jgi:glutaconate CoA-transferase subunit B
LTILFEGGVIGAFVEPGKLPPSTNDQRCTRRANMVLGSADVLLLLQRGYVDVGFMGGAQIDQYGNINTSVLGPDYWHPKVRLPGTGGANDIASLCREVIIVTPHEKRRFIERVDFVTSPAWLRGDGSRRAAGLLFGGVSRVVTTLGILGFDPDSKRMWIEATHPGVSADTLRLNTGFPLLDAPRIEVTEPPSDEELEMLRALDPERRFLG